MTLICPNAIATILYIRYGMFLHFDRLNVDSMDRSAQTGGNVMTGVRAGNAFPPPPSRPRGTLRLGWADQTKVFARGAHYWKHGGTARGWDNPADTLR